MDLDSVAIIRASSLGGCTKAIGAGLLGYLPQEFPERYQGYMEEGDLHEGNIVARLERGGFEVIDSQREVNLWIIPGVLLVQGHIDGRFRHKVESSPWRLLEIKTMGETSYRTFEKMEWETPGLVQKYKWQISAYMLALQEPATLIVKNRNTGAQKGLEIEEPFYSLSEVRARCLEIWNWVQEGILPEKCEETYPCPFSYLHSPAELSLSDSEELFTLGREYQIITEKLKDLEGLKEVQRDLRQKIIVAMGKDKKLILPNMTISRWKQKSPPQLDIEAMKRDGIDLSKYRKQTEHDRLRVKLEGDDE